LIHFYKRLIMKKLLLTGVRILALEY